MKKILVIDYDQASLQTLHKTLTQEGFEVVLASDGQAGWEKFQAEKPDLVLMEAMLSKIHGFELCDRITKDPVRKVPVFIMTGVYKDRVYRTEALRTYGASEYFEKPLDMLKFVASIHALLTVPDIRPEPGAKPAAPAKRGNGEPAEGPQAVPVMTPPKEEKRRGEPPTGPKPPKAEASRVRPSSGSRSGGDMGLGLETVLESKAEREEHIRPEFLPDFGPATEAPAKPTHAPDAKSLIDDDLRLESLLNIHPDKAEHPKPERGRPERDEALDPLRILSKDLEEKSHEHHPEDHAAEDIDKLLKTTLADFGLETEKKKSAKPVPPPAAPAPSTEKPWAAAPLPQKPKPAPTPVRPPAPPAPAKEPPAKEPPAVSHAAPAPAMEKPKPVPPPHMPAAVAERPKPQPPSPPPAVAAPKTQPPPKPKPAPQPATPAPAPKAEVKPEAKEPVPAHEPHKPAEARMFKDIYAVEKKKPPLPFIAVGAGLLVVAAVGFFILRPKHAPKPVDSGLSAAVTQTQSSVPENTPETTVPSLSEEKLKAVKAKPQATQKPAEPLPNAAEAIVPPLIVDASRLSAKSPAEKKPDAKAGAGTVAGAGPDAKTEGTKTADTKAAENLTAQSQEPPPVGAEAAATGGATAAQPPPAAKANPGDLVDLVAVDDQPKILKSVEPLYPAQARRFGKEGSITVNALINEAGSVIETGILKGLKDDMGLEKAAVDAVRKWKFQPAKKDGVNVKVWKPIVITFRADKTGIP